MDLEDFKYGGTNVTSFCMVDPQNPEFKEVVKSWTLGIQGSNNRINQTNFKACLTKSFMKFLSLNLQKSFVTDCYCPDMMYDDVPVFAKALHQLDQSQVITNKPLSCSGEEIRAHGNSLIN